MKFKYIHDDVFKANVYFYWGCTLDECHESVRKKLKISKETIESWRTDNDDKVCGRCFTMTAPDVYPIYVIWVQRKKDFFVLNHEALHLACRILRDRGIEYTNSEEVLTYYHEYLIQKLWHLMGRKK